MNNAFSTQASTISQSAEWHHQMFVNHSAVMLIIDPATGSVIDANPAACRFYGYPLEAFRSVTIYQINTLPPDKINEAFDEIVSRKRNELFFSHRLASGEVRDVEVHSVPVSFDDRTLLFAIIHDITERRRAEAELQAHREQLEDLVERRTKELEWANRELNLTLDATTEGIWKINLVTGELKFSPRYYTMLGYEPDEFPASFENWRELVHTEDFQTAVTRVEEYFKAQSGRYDTVYRLRAKSGEYRWIHATGYVVERDSEGKTVRVIGNHEDITERMYAENRLKTALREKEVLLKEIHHRVKNNLQIIASLLRLQENHLSEPALKEALRMSRNRVKSMALIHEKLYNSEDITRIDFGNFIRSMVNELIRTYGKNNIILDLVSDDVYFELEAAIPLSLIITEIVSNSLKHAFPDGRPGVITITLSVLEENSVILTVHDNGVGFPEGLGLNNTPSLGLTLVNDLVEQIDGRVEHGNDKGTLMTITFTISK
jgi:PAS domain S-box-containing protein